MKDFANQGTCPSEVVQLLAMTTYRKYKSDLSGRIVTDQIRKRENSWRITV